LVIVGREMIMSEVNKRTTKAWISAAFLTPDERYTHHLQSDFNSPARSAMSRDLAIFVDRASKAARSAHNDYQALYLAVGSASIAPSLVDVGADLDSLSITLELLSKSTAALSSKLARDVFESRMSADVKLSRAIVLDLNTTAARLRSMTPSTSSEPEEIMHEHDCRDVSEMVKRYDRAVSVVLRHHDMCVRRMIRIAALH
jgi:hypothetical protein